MRLALRLPGNPLEYRRLDSRRKRRRRRGLGNGGSGYPWHRPLGGFFRNLLCPPPRGLLLCPGLFTDVKLGIDFLDIGGSP
ncbi:MAG: hypothetical protein D6819_03090 [Gammaproteobacteria bacterium]|nr:MAG: hypothetical protein D6819_03090 [Gammaproteobacteria bacterium]